MENGGFNMDIVFYWKGPCSCQLDPVGLHCLIYPSTDMAHAE